jgi:3-deoxy-D-manno-octulosonate 8-phosphate phosphatase (KDO 8-P phosphatase)
LTVPLDDAELARRAGRLEWLLLDADGVLTDGRLYYGGGGERLKVFHVRDGLGVRLAQRGGLKVGVLSGRASPALARRLAELGLDAVITGRSDKARAFAEFLDRHRAEPERVAYAGDDLLDLPVLARCGLSFAPADAVAEVRAAAHRVLAAPGGGGAVRELVELLLKARGAWAGLVDGLLERKGAAVGGGEDP